MISTRMWAIAVTFREKNHLEIQKETLTTECSIESGVSASNIHFKYFTTHLENKVGGDQLSPKRLPRMRIDKLR